MHMNMKPYEGAALVGAIDPDAYTANTYSSGWVDMSKFARLMAVFLVGEMQSSSTVICKLQHASNSGGSDAEDITGKTATTLTQAGSDSDKQVVINLRPDELVGSALSFKNGTSRYVRAQIVVANAASDAAAALFGFHARNGEASGNDATTVDEVL